MYYDTYTGEKPTNFTSMKKDTFCVDERLDDLHPYNSHQVPWPWPNLTNATQFGELPHGGMYESKLFDASVSKFSADAVMEWRLNDNTMHVEWDNPTLERIQQGRIGNLSNAIILPGTVKWFYLLLTNGQQAGPPAAHPMHLHGHDYYVLSQSSYPWNGTVKTDNPPRRDTAMLNAGQGHLLLAWKIDNPGVWLFHCHLGWHTAMGFDIQFVEVPEMLPFVTNWAALEGNCQEWKAAAAKYGIYQLPNDSGV